MARKQRALSGSSSWLGGGGAEAQEGGGGEESDGAGEEVEAGDGQEAEGAVGQQQLLGRGRDGAPRGHSPAQRQRPPEYRRQRRGQLLLHAHVQAVTRDPGA